jgi:hypothetical protein
MKRIRRAAVMTTALLLVVTAGVARSEPAPPSCAAERHRAEAARTRPSATRCVRVDELQAIGTHNSYHVHAGPSLFALLTQFDPTLASTLDYGQAPLPEQLERLGMRQIELDVFADTAGGRYADPAGPRIVSLFGLPPDPVDPGRDVLTDAGFKVLHVQDIDFRSTCLTFVACLTQLRDWSDANPAHVPVLVLVEAKDDPIPDPGFGFVVPETIGAAQLDALDAEIRSVFGDDQLITPDDVRGRAPTLEAAILDHGWPTLAEARGRFIFALDNENRIRDAYVAGHPSLRGRVLFTSSPPGTPEAAFVKLNDPVADGARIRDLVTKGYVVRTRADADTVQARTGDTAQRDAALASGAQYISTDYPEPDARFTEYHVVLPGGTVARCNPVSAPRWCNSADLEPLG